MNPQYVMRRAAQHDLGVVLDLLNQRVAWLRAAGNRQWNTRSFDAVMADSVDRGETWILWNDHDPLATITLTTIADKDFWSPEERRTPAFYFSKLATSLHHRAEGLGAQLVDWASAYAAQRGVFWLRWDVWRTNARLHDYYRDLGATHLRTMEVTGRNSGTLFELSRAGHRSRGITTATDFAPLLTLGSTEASSAADTRPVDLYGYAGVDAAGNQLGHESFRIVSGWSTRSLASRDVNDPRVEPVTVGQHSRPLLYDTGDGWHLHGSFSKPVDGWPATLNPGSLHAGRVYRLQLSHDRATVQLLGDVDHH